MRRFVVQMSPARRQQILDEARIAGRLGMDRLPDVVHSLDTSDSLILKALDAQSLGRAEREQERAK
jgi:hypothetical protein